LHHYAEPLNSTPITHNATIDTMAATQQLGDDVWTYTDAPAPKVNDVLNQVADFLSAVGFKKTLKAIEKEAKGDGFEIDSKAWKQAVEDGSTPALTQLWHEWQAKKGGKAEVDDDSSSASSDSESESSSESSSEDSDSDSDSDNEAMVVDVKAEVASSDSSSESEAEVKPKAKTNSKRKRSPTPASSSASSSEESSDSDSSSDDAPPAKKRVVEKKASSGSSSESSSESSIESSSSDSSSESESSSDESSSESEAEAPAPKKKESKKEKKETKEEPKAKEAKKEKKEKKESTKAEDISASSSATLGRPSPDAVEVEIVESAEDSTAGMHPSRLAMLPAALKPKVTAVAVTVDKNGKKQNVPFSRISADQYVDPRLASNAYVPYDYAEKAHRDLIVTKGKGFTKEKNKKKRGKFFLQHYILADKSLTKHEQAHTVAVPSISQPRASSLMTRNLMMNYPRSHATAMPKKISQSNTQA
jgi:hypothetical protein